MNIQKYHFFILFGIIFLSVILRFYRLDSLPPSLEWDEVATGYDANAILQTGKDQYGNFLPLTIRSLDDYKPPLYTYLTSISIAIFGWNDFAVRFPAALLGVFAIYSTYLLTFELFKRRDLSLLSAFFLAISPWHVNFSRLALETNSTIFFTTAAVWAFIYGLRNGKWLVVSALLFGLDLYLYHNARVFVPLLGVVLLVLYRFELVKQKKYFFIAAAILAIFAIRLIPIITSIEGQMRFNGSSIFTPAVPLDIAEKKQQYSEWRSYDTGNNQYLFTKIFHSEKVLFAIKLFRHYIIHYDPTFWLFTLDSPRHHISEGGILYFIDLPFIYLGLYFLFRQKEKRTIILLICWFLFAPIPAMVTRDVPHSLRTAIFLPTFQIFIALGLIQFIRQITINKLRYGMYTVITGLYFLNFLFFTHQYFTHFATDTSEYWQYGRREAALFADSVKDKYDRVLVSTQLEMPHIFFLYYLKYDPKKYLAEGGTFSGGWAEDRNRFDKYEFKPIDYEKMRDGKTLFIGVPREFLATTIPLKKIYYLNGKEAIWIVD